MKVNKQVYDPDAGFGPIKPGRYYAEIIESENATSSAGADMIKLTLKILRSVEDGSETFKNRQVYNYIVDGAEFTSKNILDVFNSAAVSVDTVPEDVQACPFKGLVCQVQIKNEEYQGEFKPKVAYFANPGRGALYRPFDAMPQSPITDDQPDLPPAGDNPPVPTADNIPF